jgi:hypothetical protein
MKLTQEERDKLNRTAQRFLDKFDFEKVEKTMEALDWKWQGHRPTVHALRTQAYGMLFQLIDDYDKNGVVGVHMGGFEAWLDLKRGQFGLAFRITEQSSEYHGGDWT